MNSTESRCPRCGGPMPVRQALGALSRTDNQTYVCSPCGSDEGMRDWLGHPLPAQADWPLGPLSPDPQET